MKIRKMTLSLDKLDQEQLSSLKTKTGKSEIEIIKLALNELHGKIVENKKEVAQQNPVYIYVYPSYPSYPYWYQSPFVYDTSPSWIISNGTVSKGSVNIGEIGSFPCYYDNTIKKDDGHFISVSTTSDGINITPPIKLNDNTVVEKFVSSVFGSLNNQTNKDAI